MTPKLHDVIGEAVHVLRSLGHHTLAKALDDEADKDYAAAMARLRLLAFRANADAHGMQHYLVTRTPDEGDVLGVISQQGEVVELADGARFATIEDAVDALVADPQPPQ